MKMLYRMKMIVTWFSEQSQSEVDVILLVSLRIGVNYYYYLLSIIYYIIIIIIIIRLSIVVIVSILLYLYENLFCNVLFFNHPVN